MIGMIITGFFIGCVFCAILSVANLNKGLSKYAYQIEMQLLLFVAAHYQRVLQCQKGLYLSLEQKGMDLQKIKIIKNEDEHDNFQWQKSMIQFTKDTFPSNLRRYTDYDDFSTAMKHVAAYYLKIKGIDVSSEEFMQDETEGKT